MSRPAILAACIAAAVVALLLLALGSPSSRSLSVDFGFGGKETPYCREQRKVCKDKCQGGTVDFKVRPN